MPLVSVRPPVAVRGLEPAGRDRRGMFALPLALLLAADPAPAATETKADPPAETTDTPADDDDEPQLQWPGPQPMRVARPGYGLGVEEVERSVGRTKFRLTRQQWETLVDEDPMLHELQRRSRMRPAGIILLSMGSAHLLISGALALDGFYAETAIVGLFQWGMPVIVLVTGAVLTAIGVRARKRLQAERQRLYVGAQANGHGGGATATIRF